MADEFLRKKPSNTRLDSMLLVVVVIGCSNVLGCFLCVVACWTRDVKVLNIKNLFVYTVSICDEFLKVAL